VPVISKASPALSRSLRHNSFPCRWSTSPCLRHPGTDSNRVVQVQTKRLPTLGSVQTMVQTMRFEPVWTWWFKPSDSHWKSALTRAHFFLSTSTWT
jgi:hypothetical protein